MVYLDYSATTPVNEEVLDSFIKASRNFIANPNSIHKLGMEANDLINQAASQIASLLHVKPNEIIYTSGSSEANNLAIKGVLEKYENRGKKIITTKFEHSSIYGPLNYLDKFGYEVSFVETDEFGVVDLKHLKELITEDTALVSIGSVNSEIGIVQPIDKIAKIVKENNRCFFHCDMTQSVGKEKISLENIDLATFSAHKFYGIKGIGVLVKKENIKLEPIIHGGHSTTIYRSGTPALPLIVSFAKALRIALEKQEEKFKHVSKMNRQLQEEMKKINGVHVNSNEYCLPHILNFSVPGIKPETLLHSLAADDIYISTKTACSSKEGISTSVYALTNDLEKAKSSLRVSISHLTTEEEIKAFVASLKKNVMNLYLR